MLVYCDVETTRFFSDPEIARLPRAAQIPALATYVGVALTYDQVSGWRTWWPQDMPALWAVLRGNQIAGWNVIHFDVPLIQQAAALAGVSDPGLDPWTALDLFAEIRTRTSRWYKLEEIAQANLGRGKSGDGQLAAEWLRSGDPILAQHAADYCRLDVQLVRDLHQIAGDLGLLLPARGKDTDPALYRYWINDDGSRWQLAMVDRVSPRYRSTTPTTYDIA